MRKTVEELTELVLVDVGEKALKHVEAGEIAMHTRRPMTEQEEKGITRPKINLARAVERG